MPDLTAREAKRVAKTVIIEALTKQDRWSFPDLKQVVATICRQYDVEFHGMMHSLGLA